MKKSLIPIAVAMVAALTVVSCKNNRKAQSQQPAQEVIQQQKQALADSVLAIIDGLVEKYQEACDKGDFSLNLILSDEEKMLKPDYLLDPSLAPTFVTKDQKITALGYYLADYPVRNAYGMPLDASKEVILKLATEVNYPFDVYKMFADQTIPTSEIVKYEYNAYKERNDLATFWKIQYRILLEIEYLFVKNPELFMGKITEDQNQAITDSWEYFYEAISIYADSDEEMKYIKEHIAAVVGEYSLEEIDALFKTKESAIDACKKDVLHYIDRRNAFLQ